MIVITLSNCPASLRGDLTKWFFEVSTNVFVGRVSARVRDELWERIVRSCKNGRAVMVYAVNNEQHFQFRVHNSEWKPIDFEGIKLMMRPAKEKDPRQPGYSKASTFRKVKRIRAAKSDAERSEEYEIFIASGERSMESSTFSLGAILKESGMVVRTIEIHVTETEESDKDQVCENLHELIQLVSDNDTIVNDVPSTMEIFHRICIKYDTEMPKFDIIDIQKMARDKLYNLRAHNLDDLKKHYGIVCDSGDAISNGYSTM